MRRERADAAFLRNGGAADAAPQQFCAELRARLASTQEDLVGEIARLQQSARLLADLLAARDKAA